MDSDFDDDDEEEEDPYEGKYGFFLEDMSMVIPLAATIRGLLAREDLTPRQISELGVFLYAVERLPMVTEGISMALMLKLTVNNERNYQEVRLDEESFRLEEGGYVYDPAVGGDSFGTVIFEVSKGGGRDGEPFEAVEFMESFAAVAGDTDYKVILENDKDDAFDQWDQPMPADPWEGLDTDY
jgi:hypothetical protein